MFSHQEISDLTKARAAVAGAQAALQAALDSAPNSHTDPEVRAARIRLANAEAYLRAIEEPLKRRRRIRRRAMAICVATGLCMVGLWLWAGVRETIVPIYVSNVVCILGLLLAWFVARRD